MLAGHYVTALIARQKAPAAPIWLLLLAAISLDALWVTFAFAGLEVPSPNNWLEATFLNLHVNMDYSHDLIPAIGWAFAMLLIAWGITMNFTIALWCAGLVVFHFLCDMLAGFKHHVMGLDSPALGLDLYNSYPSVAILIEAALCIVCVAWFVRARKLQGRPIHKSYVIGLYLLFVGGTLLWLPVADRSILQWLGISS